MKHLKKILAAALSGVLALTLLAGCGSWGSINKTELIKQVGDYEGVTYRDVGESQASAVEDALKKTIDLMKEMKETGEGPDQQNLLHQALRSLAHYYKGEHYKGERDISEETAAKFIEIQHNLYKTLNFDPEGYTYGYFSLTALGDFESAYFQNSLENVLAQNILFSRREFKLKSNAGDFEDDDIYNHNGTVSLKVITLDGSRYVLGFWTIAN